MRRAFHPNISPLTRQTDPPAEREALSALFAFRLAFGLSRPFFYEDETQIFLLGLRYHATGHWPFFGPDVVWTRSEIPGPRNLNCSKDTMNVIHARLSTVRSTLLCRC